MEKPYRMQRADFVFSHWIFSKTALVRDGAADDDSWERFNEKSLVGYFEEGCDIFLVRFAEFKNLLRPFGAEEEKELTFMLESLITAKKNFLVARPR